MCVSSVGEMCSSQTAKQQTAVDHPDSTRGAGSGWQGAGIRCIWRAEICNAAPSMISQQQIAFLVLVPCSFCTPLLRCPSSPCCAAVPPRLEQELHTLPIIRARYNRPPASDRHSSSQPPGEQVGGSGEGLVVRSARCPHESTAGILWAWKANQLATVLLEGILKQKWPRPHCPCAVSPLPSARSPLQSAFSPATAARRCWGSVVVGGEGAAAAAVRAPAAD